MTELMSNALPHPMGYAFCFFHFHPRVADFTTSKALLKPWGRKLHLQLSNEQMLSSNRRSRILRRILPGLSGGIFLRQARVKSRAVFRQNETEAGSAYFMDSSSLESSCRRKRAAVFALGPMGRRGFHFQAFG